MCGSQIPLNEKPHMDLTSKSDLAVDPVDEERRQFLLTSATVLGCVGAACALTPLIASWSPTAKTRVSAAPVQVDLSKMTPGEQIIVAWRGKPIWIIKRTKAMLSQLRHNTDQLRDPESITAQQPAYARNKYRSRHPEYLILVGVCTHLGCSPHYKPESTPAVPIDSTSDWPGGFCPCHGSTFDMAGRVFKGVPAPINLEVPPHYFIDAQTVVIGADKPQEVPG